MNQVAQILIDGDIAMFRKISPEPMDMHSAEISMHIARTAAESVPENLRVYSHRWLTERDIPSLLPEHMLPLMERYHSVIVDAVGISINLRGRDEEAKHVEQKLADKVAEMYADGDKDPTRVKQVITDLRISMIGI